MFPTSAGHSFVKSIETECSNFTADRLQKTASEYNSSFAKLFQQPNFSGLQSLIDSYVEPLKDRYQFNQMTFPDDFNCNRPFMMANPLGSNQKPCKIELILAGAKVPPPPDYNVALKISALPSHHLSCSFQKGCFSTECVDKDCKSTKSSSFDLLTGSNPPEIASGSSRSSGEKSAPLLPAQDDGGNGACFHQPASATSSRASVGPIPDAAPTTASSQPTPQPSPATIPNGTAQGAADFASSTSTPDGSSASPFTYLPNASTAIPACATLLCLFKAAQAARAWQKVKHEAASDPVSLEQREEKARARTLAYSAGAIAGLAVTIMQSRG